MATYSSNTTIKYTGTQVTQSRGTTGTIYTVTSGKTFVGTLIISGSAALDIAVDGTSIYNFNGQLLHGMPLYLNSGSVISCTIASGSMKVAIVGVLQENTP